MDSLDTLQPKKTLSQRAMTAALIITGAGILVNLVFYITGLDIESLTNQAVSWLNRIILLGATYYFTYVALKSHRDEDLGGYVSVGQGIGLGTLAGLISGILSALWFFLFTNFIATDLMDKIKEVSLEQMQAQGNQSAEQAEQAMEMMSFFFSPAFFAIVVVIFSIFFGFLCGLVAGLVLKKEKSYM